MDYLEELTKTMNDTAVGVEKFKSQHTEELGDLKKTVERIETRLSRPGGGVSPGIGSDASGVLSLKTSKGETAFLVQKGFDFAPIAGSGNEGFSVAEFVRDNIVGSRKSMASGPALVPTSLSNSIIDDVRRRTVIVEAGAPTLVIEGPTNAPRIDGDPTVYQHTENTDDISDSSVLVVPIALNPKVLATIIPLSQEVVEDSPNLDRVLTTSLAAAFAAKLDALTIAKLIADTDIPKSAMTEDPAVWAKVLSAVGSAMNLNQGLPYAHISAPADFISRASQLASTAGSWLGKPPALASMLELFTTGLSAGTAFMGDFRVGLLLAARSELRIEVIRWRVPGKAQHALVAHARMDGYVVQPKALYKQLKTP